MSEIPAKSPAKYAVCIIGTYHIGLDICNACIFLQSLIFFFVYIAKLLNQDTVSEHFKTEQALVTAMILIPMSEQMKVYFIK